MARRGKSEQFRFHLRIGAVADLTSIAGKLCAAEGTKVDVEDVGRIAVEHYLESVRACVACCGGFKCTRHGLATLPPAESAQEVDGAEFQEVCEAYFASYEKRRGEKPIFLDRDGAAVKSLIVKVGKGRAIELIRSTYAHHAKGDRFTIAMIAADPAAAQGFAMPMRGEAVKQKPSGLKTQRGERL
jgi:hypothetical protein